MTQDESIDRDQTPSDDAQAELETAAFEVLSRAPERWTEFSPDDLSAQETTALALLVAAELVERRCRFRLRMLNQPLAVEATITATGEYGLVEALEALSAGLWEDWRGALAAWQASDVRDSTPVHGELLDPQEWRLTASGVQPRRDLVEGRGRVVLDFVLRRWPLTFRPPVRGHGRLLRFSRPDEKAPPSPIAVANWSEGAAAFAAAFSRLTVPHPAVVRTPRDQRANAADERLGPIRGAESLTAPGEAWRTSNRTTTILDLTTTIP